MIDVLYESIRAKIKQDLPGVKWIDLDSGQLDNPEQNYPFPFPAVFVDFPNIDWVDAGERMQNGAVQVNVRIAFRIYNQTHSNTQDNAYDTFGKAMDALAMVTTIHSKMQGFSDGLTFNRLTRVSTSTEKRSDGLKVLNMIYACSARDKSAMKQYDIVTVPTITIRENINKSHLVMGMSVNDLTPLVGSNVIFTLTVENIGTESGTGALVTDVLPAGFTFVSDDGLYAGGVWTVGTVTAGQTKTLHITALVNELGSHTNVATLTYIEQPSPASHATASVIVVPEIPPS